MVILTYEEFFSELWTYFSDECITDEYYEENQDVIRDFIHSFYKIYKNTSRIDDYGCLVTDMTPMRASTMLENILTSLIKFGYACV